MPRQEHKSLQERLNVSLFEKGLRPSSASASVGLLAFECFPV